MHPPRLRGTISWSCSKTWSRNAARRRRANPRCGTTREAANEELNTLNEELKISNLEFSKVNRDFANLLESISIPLVMVGRDLRIRRFTRAIEPMLNLIPSDVGRSITDLQPQIELPDLRRLLLDAMDGGNRQPRDIRDSHGRWYSLRILPSLGPDGNTDGAVLMLID